MGYQVRSALRTIIIGVSLLTGAIAVNPMMSQPAGAVVADRALVLAETVTGGASSIEASEAAAMGLAVDVVSDATWSSMTTAQFASYRLIILGDPRCQAGHARIDAAEANAMVWGPVINGNIVIVGTDPVYHAWQGGETLTRRAIDFALAQSGKTGAYISLSCYFHGTAAATPVTLLDGIGTGGFQVTGVDCHDDAHIVAESPALSGLTDANLSNWSCSVHEAFQSWPGGLVPLAIARRLDSDFTASDGSKGYPYILAGGSVQSFPLSLDPLADLGTIGGSHTVTAQLLDGETRAPVSDASIQFDVISGPNIGVTGSCAPVSCVTGSDGLLSWTYQSNGNVGEDVVQAFVDLNASGTPDSGEPITTAGMTWATIPDAPVVTTASGGDGTATVEFSAPVDDGGSPVDEYEVSCTSSDGGAAGLVSASPPLLSATVLGLTNAKTYTCEVRAHNSLGWSAWSSPSDPVVPATVPGAPSVVSVTRGNGQVTVGYAAPASNGGATIDQYGLSCTSSNGGAAGSATAIPPAVSGVVTGLTNGKSYTCRVRAHNSTGWGFFSLPSAVVVPATVPGAPSVVSVTRGNGLVTVGFAAPASNGGATIDQYGLSCTSSNGGTAGTGTATPPAVSGVVSGLTNGRSYTCRVRAHNAAGWGFWSLVSGSVTPSTVAATVPGVPTVGTVTLSGGRNATVPVASGPADNGGSTVLGYQAQCVSTNGGVTVQNLTAGASPRSVLSLDAGKAYQCQVRAVNGVGAGAWSALSNVVNVPNVPGAPTNVTARPVSTIASTGSLSVSFVAPASNGGATITSYQAQCSSNGGSTWVPAAPTAGIPSPIVVPGLTTGVAGSPAYGCRVRAVNAAGTGPWSIVSSPPVVVGSPATPTITSVTTSLTNGALGATVGQLQVTFTAGANNGSAYTGFTARCTEVGTTNVIVGTAGPAATTVTVNSVKVGSGYVCRVAGVNARGTGLYANPPVSPAAVAPATDGRVYVGSPGRPTVTGVTSPSAGRLKVSFNPPGSNNGANITSYTARCVSTNGGVSRQISGADPNINYTILNLTSGKTYQCYVAATNSRGLGIWSLPSTTIVVA